MSTGTPDSPMADCPSCPCPQLDRFWEHVQRSEWSQVRQLLDHMDGCGHWLKAVSAGAAADQQVDWVDRLSEDFPLQRTSGLFRELGVNYRWSALLDLCSAGSLRDDLKGLLVMGFVSHGQGVLSLRVFQRGSVSDSQPIDWRQRCVTEFTMTEYFQHQSPNGWKTFISQFPDTFDPSTRPLFREAVTKCIELDDADCFVALCDKWCKSVKPQTRAMISDDLKLAYSAAIEKRLHFVAKLIMINQSKLYATRLEAYCVLFDTVVEKQAWSVLPVLLTSQSRPFALLLRRKTHLYKMLSDQELWAGMAPALDQWALTLNGKEFAEMVTGFAQERWPSSMSHLKQWCEDTGHAHLAFVLAAITNDVGMMDKVTTTFPTLQFHDDNLWFVVQLFAANEMPEVSIVTVLKNHPVSTQFQVRTVVESMPPLYKIDRLVAACENEGVVDWALAFRCKDLAYIRQHHQRCQSPAVLDWILTSSQNWDIVREVVDRCTTTELLSTVFWSAARGDQEDIVESLLSRVDPRALVGNKTLLQAICEQGFSKDAQLKVARLFVASGLSTFQANTERDGSHALRYTEPLLLRVHADLAKLMIAAGTYSKKFLYNQSTMTDWSLRRLCGNYRRHQTFEMTYRVIREAASAPCRLIHLARLEVSHCIGCRPGRSDRIHSLPLPSSLKDLVSFKDVLESRRTRPPSMRDIMLSVRTRRRP